MATGTIAVHKPQATRWELSMRAVRPSRCGSQGAVVAEKHMRVWTNASQRAAAPLGGTARQDPCMDPGRGVRLTRGTRRRREPVSPARSEDALVKEAAESGETTLL
jgi:hypothetical protein